MNWEQSSSAGLEIRTPQVYAPQGLVTRKPGVGEVPKNLPKAARPSSKKIMPDNTIQIINFLKMI